MSARTVADRTRSVHDHNTPAHALASPALRVLVTRPTLPWADRRTRMVTTMSGWDASASREAARARYADAVGVAR